MKSKKEISELLELLVSGEIDAEGKRELEDLMEADEAIRQEYILRKKIDNAIRKTDVLQLREKLHRLTEGTSEKNVAKEPTASYSKWFFTAAAILILIGLYFLPSIFTGNQVQVNKNPKENSSASKPIPSLDQSVKPLHTNTPSTNQNTKPSPVPDDQSNQRVQNASKEEGHEELYAANFSESSYFESYIDDFRSGTVVIVSPQPEEEYPVGAEISFRWVQNVSDSIMIHIFNNKEDKLYSVDAVQDFKLSITLKPGLYYWKLETEHDLLYMNKFYVR